jgi:hypothetical protein
MIEAADEFVNAGADALITARDAIREVQDQKDPARVKESTEAAWAARDIALRRSARVDLLFGSESGASRSADNLLNQLASVSTLLQPPDCDTSGADSAHLQASSELGSFQRLAVADIRHAAPPSATIAESLRRRRIR